jgi:acyl transferase domain-containing protein
MACIVPGADSLAQFWQNIVAKVDCVTDPPAGWTPDPASAPEGRLSEPLYTTKGGYLGDRCRFDPLQYGVMPAGVEGAEPDQFLALRCAFEAVADAGIPDLPLNREKTGVFLGRGIYFNRGTLAWVQHGMVIDQVIALLRQIEPGRTDAEMALLRAELKRNLPPFCGETVPGLVPCATTGRIANRLNLKGPTYYLDAACASSLIALEHGMRELRTGRCDAVLAGGVQVTTSPLIHQLFCHIEALSRTGQIAPFSATANGTILGEGCGMVLLKRRRDAERDGHRIYAILKAVGVSSDGRGAGLLAPCTEGQQLALRRAYEEAGFSPQSVALMEAHGTGIPQGDRTEMESLKACFGARQDGWPSVALGSVKSMIGHLVPASAIAAIIKTALALYHRVLPPTLHAEEVNPDVGLAQSPFYLSTQTRPWIHGDRTTPRRAGINAFGFGGINAHAILEEHVVADEMAQPRLETDWPVELLVLSAATPEALGAKAQALAGWLSGANGARLLDVAAACAAEEGLSRLGIVAKDKDDLQTKLLHAARLLEQPQRDRIQDRGGIFWYRQPLAQAGRVAFVFPGEGAQYPNMLADLCRHFPEVRREFDLTDAAFRRAGSQPLSRLVFPPPEMAAQAEAEQFGYLGGLSLVSAAERALMALLRRLEVLPDAIVGHSNGEFGALQAAGAFGGLDDEDELIRCIVCASTTAYKLAQPGLIPSVVMTAVGGADPVAIERVVASSGGRLAVAIDNCPRQVVLAGDEDASATALQALRGHGGLCERLPWRQCYHTPAFAPACGVIDEFFEAVNLGLPKVEMWSCTTATRYPSDLAAVRDLAVRQLQCRLRFRETIEAMYLAGVRLFVEVGPRGNLSGFVADALGKRPHAAVPLDVIRRHGVEQLCQALAMLAAHGVRVKLSELYPQRSPRPLDLTAAPPPAPIPAPPLNQLLPQLRLRDSVVAKLRDSTPPSPRLESGNGDVPGRLSDSLSPRRSNGKAASSNGSIPPAPRQTSPSIPGAAVQSRVLAEFQQTMRVFLETQERVTVARFARKPAADAPALVGAPGSPFLTRVLTQEAERVIAECDIDPSCHRFLADHAFFGRGLSIRDPQLHGLPTMPLAATLELMAEAALLLRPGLGVCAVGDVRTLRWLTFETGARTVRVEAALDTPTTVKAIVSQLDQDEPGAPIATAVFELTAQDEDLGPPEVLDHARTPFSFPPEEVYRFLFHGPAFQGIEVMEACDPHGTRCVLREPDSALIDPGRRGLALPVALLDLCGQVAGMVLRAVATDEVVTLSFPNSIERVEFRPQRQAQARLTAISRVQLTDSHLLSDVEMTTQDGQVVLRALGRSEELARLPADLYSYRNSPRQVHMSRLLGPLFLDVPEVEHCTICIIGNVGSKSLVNRLWAQSLAHQILSTSERKALHDLGLPPVQAAAWLAGRVVLKDAVRVRCRLDVAMADVEILGTAPARLQALTASELGVLLREAHMGFTAVAVAADSHQFAGVGIGLEVANEDARVNDFDAQERECIEEAARLASESPAAWYAAARAASVAAAQALGGEPDRPRVIAVDPGLGQISLNTRGGRRVEAYWRVHGQYTIGLCLLRRQS